MNSNPTPNDQPPVIRPQLNRPDQHQPSTFAQQPPTQHFPQPPRKSGNKTGLIIGSIAAVAILGVLAVVGAGLLFYNMVVVDSSEMKTVASSDRISEIEVPKNWWTSVELNDEATNQAANMFGEKYALVITEPKSDFGGGFRSPFGNTSINDVSDYGELVVSLMKNNEISLHSQLEEPLLRVNGRVGRRYKLTGNIDGVDAVMWLTVVDGERHYHQVLVWTLHSRESQNEETLLKVVDSFRETVNDRDAWLK